MQNQTPSDSNNRYFQNSVQVADGWNSRPHNEPQLSNQTYFRNELQVTNQNPPPQHNIYSPQNKFPPQEFSRSVIVSDEEKINALIGSVTNIRKHNINWALYLFILFFSILVIVLGGSLFHTHMTKMIKQKEDFGVIKNIIHNLSQPPIIDLKLMTLTQSELEAEQVSSNQAGEHHSKHLFHQTDDQDTANNLNTVSQVQARSSQELAQLLNTNSKQFRCPLGYTMQEIGSWPGVEAGCLCSDGVVHPSIHCLFKNQEECKHVKEQVSLDLWHWGNQRFCVKRAKNFKWVGTKACPQNMKKCQVGLCMMLQEPCPISSIEMTNDQPLSVLIDQVAETRPLRKIVTTSDNTKSILVSLVVIGGANTNAQCFNSNLGPQFESKKTYPFSGLETKGCPNRMMLQYSKNLDTQLEVDVYKQNYLGAKLARIPFYDKYTDKLIDHLNLQSIQRVQVADKVQCDQFDQQALEDVKQQSDNLHLITKVVSLFLLIVASLIVITAVILFIMRNQTCGTLFISGVQQTKIYFYFALVCAIILVLFGLIYFHHVDMKNGLKQYHQEFNSYIINNCFTDAIVKDTLKNIDKFSQDVYIGAEYQAKIGMVLGIFFILVSMILLLLQQKTYEQQLFTDPWK